MSRLLKILFLLVGLGLFAWAVLTVDLGAVLRLLAQMGVGFFLIFLTYGLVTLLDTISWKYNFKPDETRAFTVWQLWRIRQIGLAYNLITPLGSVGGEPVKAQLLKDYHDLSRKQGLASQVISRTVSLTALILFLVPGIFLILRSELVSEEFKLVSLAGLVVFSTLIFLFFLFQITGTLSRVTSWIGRLPVSSKIRGFLNGVETMDGLMVRYYREHPGRTVRSVFFALAGWLVGIGEMYLIMYFLGNDPTLADVWIVEALFQLIHVGSFFIPLSLGAQEGGMILTFMAMGMPGGVGLAVSLVRRIKELAWVGLGLLMGWGMAFKPAKIQVDPSESQ